MGAPSEKKEAILNAMLELIVERGLHDAPMSLLAKRSGASPGVIYHYFPSKDDLIHAVYQHVSALKLESLLKGYVETMPPRELFFLLWLNAYEFYREHEKAAWFLDQYQHSTYCRREGVWPAEDDEGMRRIMKIFQPTSKGGILKDLPEEALHSMTFGVIDDLARAAERFPEPVLRAVGETIWKAVRAENGSSNEQT